MPVPDLHLIVGGQGHDGLAALALGLTAAGQQMLEERERAPTRGGDDFAAVGIDDCERPMLCHGLGEDRAEALLVGGDEGGSLGIAIRVGRSFDQSLVGDLARLR